jgi:hypothetical protein
MPIFATQSALNLSDRVNSSATTLLPVRQETDPLRQPGRAIANRSSAAEMKTDATPPISRTRAGQTLDQTVPNQTVPTTTLSFETYAYRVRESAGTATLVVSRSGDTASTVTVNYSTGSKNTAKPGEDFEATSGSLTFKPGETRQTITVKLLDDSRFESAEVTRVTLLNPVGAVVGKQKEALLSILNDDAPTEAQLKSKATQSLTVGETIYYIGYNQVANGSAIGNKDPWLASVSQGKLNWYRDDYEVTPDDGTGTHLFWDDRTRSLYAAFTATGTQGFESEDFRRFARKGWLNSYTDGSPNGGGGGRAAIIAKLNPTTGDVTNASFLTALNNRKTNSLMVKSLSMAGDRLVVNADSAFAPRRPDKTAMRPNSTTPQPAVSPNYRVEFTPDLSQVVSATAVNYS